MLGALILGYHETTSADVGLVREDETRARAKKHEIKEQETRGSGARIQQLNR